MAHYVIAIVCLRFAVLLFACHDCDRHRWFTGKIDLRESLWIGRIGNVNESHLILGRIGKDDAVAPVLHREVFEDLGDRFVVLEAVAVQFACVKGENAIEEAGVIDAGGEGECVQVALGGKDVLL